MEFLQLKYFYDSAHLGSFAKTADKYMVPASSVSAAVKRLETELDCKLFNRTANRISLNDNGKKLVESLRIVFKELEQTLYRISNKLDDTREIKILIKTLRSVMTERIIDYKSRYENTKFKLTFDFDETDLENYDIIIDTKKDIYSGYEAFELLRHRILIYAASKSPLIGQKLSLKQLSDHTFIGMSHSGNQYQALKKACNKAGFSPNTMAHINDSACFVKIIKSGVAIGVSGEISMRTDKTDISPLNITDFKEFQTVCVYYKPESVYGIVENFINFLKESREQTD